MWDICILNFGEISNTNFNFGDPIPLLLHRYGDIWHGPLIHAKFHPIRATCRPCWAKNLNIAPSNLYTGAWRCAQCCRGLKALSKNSNEIILYLLFFVSR